MIVSRICAFTLRLGQTQLGRKSSHFLFSPFNHNKITTGVFVSNRLSSDMSQQALAALPEVDIDPSGTFKYILIRVYGKEEKGHEPSKVIVRGYADCPFHGDIYDKVDEGLQKNNLEGECLGGGRIKHENKKLHVYGYSQGYGKADHELSVSLLKKKYPDYDITWSDEGY